MRSSTTPPDSSSQHSVYCALPGPIRPRSLDSVAFTNAAAPGPRTCALPRWLTSNTPTASRTAVCSLTTPPPGYSIGISQPPKSASFAPRATWRSCRGERRKSVMRSDASIAGFGRPGATTPCGRSHDTKPRANIRRAARTPRAQPVEGMGSPVTTVTLSNAKASGLKVDALVIGVTKGPSGVALAPGAEDVDKAFKGRLAATVDALGGTGAKNEVTKVSSLGATSAQVVVAVGLGATPGGKNATPYDDETIRR